MIQLHPPSVAAILAATLLSFLQPTAQAQPLPYTSGHMDLAMRVVGGTFIGYWKNDGAIVDSQVTSDDFEAGDIVATAIFDANTPPPIRPAGSQWDFLGVAAGEPIYILPSGGIPNTIPYLGASTEDTSLVSINAESIRITLTGMVGPSGTKFSAYTTSSNVFMEGTPSGTSGFFSLEIGDHQHYNWSFSHMGSYELTFSYTAYDSNDDIIQGFSGSSTFGFAIIPEPTTALFLALSSILFLFHRKKRICPVGR